MFDIDSSGYIEAPDLLRLGKARRELGQKAGEWTTSMNNALIAKMDTYGDGKVGSPNFCQYFDNILPHDMEEFEAIIECFMQVAEHTIYSEPSRLSRSSPQANKSTGSKLTGSMLLEDRLNKELHSPVQIRSTKRSAQTSERLLEDRLNRKLSESPAVDCTNELKRRIQVLEEVFYAFDIDGSGFVEEEELLELGKARQTLKQKDREWDRSKNDKLIERVDNNFDGKISKQEFLDGFAHTLRGTAEEVDDQMRQFKEVAKFVRAKGSLPYVAPSSSPSVTSSCDNKGNDHQSREARRMASLEARLAKMQV